MTAWTREPPKEPGHYFYRLDAYPDEIMCVTLIRSREGPLMLVPECEYVEHALSSSREWWPTPIPPPQEASDGR